MKFSVLQQDLLPVLQSVARSCGVHSTLPVLDNILLSAEGSPRGEAGKKQGAPMALKVAATNLEIGVIKFLSVDVTQPGDVTVPAKALLEIVSGLPQAKIDFSSEGEILSLTSSKFKAQINGISASEFPIIPLPEGEKASFPKDVFLSCSAILFASAVDEGRPVLTGILTEVKDGKLDFVATDGFRLAHCQVKLPNSETSFKSLIPKKTFEEVLRVISEQESEQVSISSSASQNQIIFKVSDTTISSRLIEGQFPSWEKIIPQNIVTRILVDKAQLISAIKLSAVFAKDEANIVVLKTLKTSLGLESSAKQLGSQQNEIDAQVSGEELKIAFNTRFLQDAISSCPSTQISMEFSGSLSASLIKPIGVDGLEYIVMPVRLS